MKMVKENIVNGKAGKRVHHGTNNRHMRGFGKPPDKRVGCSGCNRKF